MHFLGCDSSEQFFILKNILFQNEKKKILNAPHWYGVSINMGWQAVKSKPRTIV